MLNGKLLLANYEDQIPGVWRNFWCGNGWTALATWHRGIDPRPNAHATFLVRGMWIGEGVLTALERVRVCFPVIWETLPEQFVMLP